MSLPLYLVGKPLEVLFRIPPFPTLRQTLPGTQATPPGGSGGVLPAGDPVITTWVQSTPVDTLTLTHNLHAYPQVLVIDEFGEIVDVNVTYASDIELTIDLSAPLTFTVHLNT